MGRPTLVNFNQLAQLTVEKYERYLPTAFDESMTLLEKVNKIIEYVNTVSQATNGLVSKWNEVMEWVMEDGLNDAIIKKLDTMATDGTLDLIINQEILGSRARIVVSNDENIPEHNPLTFWYQVTSEIEKTGNITVSDDEPSSTNTIWYDVE